MTIRELRFFLTDTEERILFKYRNDELLIGNNVDYNVFKRISDDINLMPYIRQTLKGIKPIFCKLNYKEEYYSLSELLSFIYASINPEWNIVRGKEVETNKEHFYLKCGEYIYDPSLAVLVIEEVYSSKYVEIEEIKNEDIEGYLNENNNLSKYYKRLNLFGNKFSLKFINRIKQEFNRNVNAQYEINDENIQEIRNGSDLDIRKVLSHRREFELREDKIVVHPDVDSSTLEKIEVETQKITSIMKKKYPDYVVSYTHNTAGNCYMLSILYNLYNGEFKLIQGGYTYRSYNEFFPNKESYKFYQHSWLEKDDIVYDPEKRIIVPKSLYYKIFEKKDEYTQQQTRAILKKIGFNLTYFSDYLSGKRIGNNESIIYRASMNSIGIPEKNEEGTKLINALAEIEI